MKRDDFNVTVDLACEAGAKLVAAMARVYFPLDDAGFVRALRSVLAKVTPLCDSDVPNAPQTTAELIGSLRTYLRQAHEWLSNMPEPPRVQP